MKKLAMFIVVLLFCGIAFADHWYDCTPSGVTSAGKQNDPTFLKGYVDVTWYGADKTGVTDSTSAIQTAIDEAMACSLVIYFPAGTYLISDTIDIDLPPSEETENWASLGAAVLRGDTTGTSRPKIKLKSGATGFGSASSPKNMFVFWQKDSGATDYKDNDTDQNFQCKIIGIDIDTNQNAGAVAVEFGVAQGATLQDMTITATNSYAGIKNLEGLGVGVYNVEIVGGKYAVYQDTTDYADVYKAVGNFFRCKFTNQTTAVVGMDTDTAAEGGIFVGCEFSNSNANVPLNNQAVRTGRGGIVLVDCIIDINCTTTAWYYRDDMSVAIWDCYIRGASIIIDSWTVSDTSHWTWIKYYFRDDSHFKNLVDGTVTDATTYSYKEEGKTYDIDDLRYSLIEKHIYNEDTFPSWQDSDIYNVKDAGATGDGTTDDAAAIQSAINNHEKIFFPKGRYCIGSQIVLKANTKIIGCDQINTCIRPLTTWQPSGSSEQIMITTEDSATGDAIIADIQIGNHAYDKNNDSVIDTWTWSDGKPGADQWQFTPLEWKVGENSIIRNVRLGLPFEWQTSTESRTDYARLRINSNGGGKFIMIRGCTRSTDSTTGSLVINGTSQQIEFYSSNFHLEPTSNINLSSVSNARFYAYCNEGQKKTIDMDSCNNVAFFFVSDNNINGPITEVTGDSNNVLISMLTTKNDYGTGEVSVTETYSSTTTSITENNPCLFRRGWPSFTTITSRPEENPTKVWITGGSMTGASIN